MAAPTQPNATDQTADQNAAAPHIPVLLEPLIEKLTPISGVWLDGTLGAGGYARALLNNGAARVIGVDRDPEALTRAQTWAGEFGARFQAVEGCFGDLDQIARDNEAPELDGVVLDIGVSSMQIDMAARGFSFMQDGPLDMRMAQSGPSAADIVNEADEADLADILYLYGEERASRRIAKAIVAARAASPILSTAALCAIVESALPRAKPGAAHPATRSFQALRIAVNDELGELVRGLVAAEAVLKSGGFLAVVTFHSLEDRIVKRFIQTRSGAGPRPNRFQPEEQAAAPKFSAITRRAVAPDETELAANPRSRSAKLRIAKRLDAPAGDVDAHALGLPRFSRPHANAKGRS